MTTLNLFIISIIWVLILDLCGFATTIDTLLYKLIYKKRAYREDAHFKPWDCSLCMTWWSCLIYLIVVNALTLPYIAFSLLFAWSTTITRDILTLIKDLIIKLINTLYNTLNL